MRPSDVKAVNAVVGGDHGDTGFQFGAAISAEMQNGEQIYFKVTTVELICRKDTSKLLEVTILTRLTTGLKIISTQPLHLYSNDKDSLVCSFNTPPPDSPPRALLLQDHTTFQISVFVTGNLAFQAMILGREAMSGQHCMMCQLSQKEFNENKEKDGLPWTFHDLVHIGTEVCTQLGGKPLNGVKQEPWWPFLKVEHHIVPLLHCLIVIGNNLLN